MVQQYTSKEVGGKCRNLNKGEVIKILCERHTVTPSETIHRLICKNHVHYMFCRYFFILLSCFCPDCSLWSLFVLLYFSWSLISQ